jgi:hypothetical protein
MTAAEQNARLLLETLRWAREQVRMYALESAPHVDDGFVTALCAAVGNISVDEAERALDRAEAAAAVEH